MTAASAASDGGSATPHGNGGGFGTARRALSDESRPARSSSGSSAWRARCLAVPAAAVVANGGGFSTPRRALSDDARPRGWHARCSTTSAATTVAASVRHATGSPMTLGSVGRRACCSAASVTAAVAASPRHAARSPVILGRATGRNGSQRACHSTVPRLPSTGACLLLGRLGDGNGGGFAAPRRALPVDARPSAWWQWQPACLLASCVSGGGDSGGCATPRRALSDDARLRAWWRRRPE